MPSFRIAKSTALSLLISSAGFFACQPMTPQGDRAGKQENQPPIIETKKNAELQIQFNDSFQLTEGNEEKELGIKIQIFEPPTSTRDGILFPFDTSELKSEFEKTYEAIEIAETIKISIELEKFGRKLLQLEIIENDLVFAMGQDLVQISPGPNRLNKKLKLKKIETSSTSFELKLNPIQAIDPNESAEKFEKTQAFIRKFCTPCHSATPMEGDSFFQMPPNYDDLIAISFLELKESEDEYQKLFSRASIRTKGEEGRDIMPPAYSPIQPTPDERESFVVDSNQVLTSFKDGSATIEDLEQTVQTFKLKLLDPKNPDAKLDFIGEIKDGGILFKLRAIPINKTYSAVLVLDYFGNDNIQEFEIGQLGAAKEDPTQPQSVYVALELDAPTLNIDLELEEK